MINIYTVGHSNHTSAHLLLILSQHEIELVADVRRYPSSRQYPQFNEPQLAVYLEENGIEYLFIGDKLGGRDDFDRIKARPGFKEGISSLVTLALQEKRVAILCAEENPFLCHRHNLLEPAFADHDVKFIHIRGNGKLEQNNQLSLFKRE